MVKPIAPNRLLWNNPNVIGVCILAMLITIAIVVWQTALRQGLLDAETVAIFYRLFLFIDYPGSLLFLSVLLLGLVPAAQRAGVVFARGLGMNPGLVAILTFCCFAAGSYWIYQAHPLAMDESAPYMQSKIFVSGNLVGHFPPALIDWLIYRPFQGLFVHVSRETGEIASAYWPGFALLLTPFMALGVPWLCNPALGAAAVWAIHRLTLELTESFEAAGASILFTLASAAFVLNAISFYAMTAHLLCNAAFSLLLLRPTLIRAAAAGLIGGLALTLHNPMPHILYAIPWLLWLALRPERLRMIPAVAAGYIPWIVIVGFGWHHLLRELAGGAPVAGSTDTGNPILVAFSIFASAFQIPSAMELTDRLIGLAKLWLWAAPALLPLAGLGFWVHRKNVGFQLLLASAFLTLLGFLFVPLNQGHGWGFRYFHSAWFVLPVFAGAIASSRGFSLKSNAARTAIGQYGYACSIGAIALMVPYFLWQAHAFIDRHVAQLPWTDIGKPSLLIINPSMGYYAPDLVQNDPFLRATVITMITNGRQADEAMMKTYFPDLVMLSRNYRGSVWGKREPANDGSSPPSTEFGDGDP